MTKNRLIVVLLIALALLSVSFVILLPRSAAVPLAIDSLAEVWDGVHQNRETGKSRNICIRGIDKMVFKAGTLEQETNIENPAENGDRLMQFSLIVDDVEYWTSGYCQAGHGYYSITLNRSLAAGEYAAALKVRCFKPDGTELNGARVNFILYVEDA